MADICLKAPFEDIKTFLGEQADGITYIEELFDTAARQQANLQKKPDRSGKGSGRSTASTEVPSSGSNSAIALLTGSPRPYVGLGLGIGDGAKIGNGDGIGVRIGSRSH